MPRTPSDSPRSSPSTKKKGSKEPQRPNNPPKPEQHRLVLLGEAAVGKTSLLERYTAGTFNDFNKATIGAAYSNATMQLGDLTVRLDIWDTAGQERYRSLAPMYYRGAQAALLCYDITSKESMIRSKDWLRELQRTANPDILIALVGNKLDLEDKREVTSEEGKTFADENSLLFMETSAKTGKNVQEIFYEIARHLAHTEPKKKEGPNLNDEDAPSKKCSC